MSEILDKLKDAHTIKWTKPYGPGAPHYMGNPHPNNEFINGLPPGAYVFGVSMSGPFASPVEIKDDDLIIFEDDLIDNLLQEINAFWDNRLDYQKLGMHYKRGIVMYGPPGTGKSGILRILAHKLIQNGGLVAVCNGSVDAFQIALPHITRAESPDRRIMVMIEDFESAVHRDEYEMLQLLDGIGDGRDGMLYVATTNVIDQIPARILRPSRFDTLLEIDAPNANIRLQYITHMANKHEGLTPSLAAEMVETSEGFTMAQIKEMVIACLIYKQSPADVRKRFELLATLCSEQDTE